MSTLNTNPRLVNQAEPELGSSSSGLQGGWPHPPAATRPSSYCESGHLGGPTPLFPRTLPLAVFPPWQPSHQVSLGHRGLEVPRPPAAKAGHYARAESPARAGEARPGVWAPEAPGAARPPEGGRPAEGGAVGKARPPLGRIASNVSDRYFFADALRPHQTGRRRDCRRKRCSASGVQLQVGPDGRVRLCGVVTCASVWACPVCAPPICAERAEEIKQVVTWARERGCEVYMLTATLRHSLGDRCADTLAALLETWRAFWQGRRAQDLKRDIGLEGYVRACELTHGANGWHPHLHTLLIVKRELKDEQLAAVKERWDSRAPGAVAGVGAHLKRVELGDEKHDYLTKLGLELNWSDVKENGPWGIARRAAGGDARAARLWHEYVKATKGHRQLTWSVGLKARAGLGARSDRDLLEADEAAEVAQVVDFSPRTWDVLVRIYGIRGVLERAVAGLDLPGGADLYIYKDGPAQHGQPVDPKPS